MKVILCAEVSMSKIKVRKEFKLTPAALREFLILHYATKRGLKPERVEVEFEAEDVSDPNDHFSECRPTPTFTGVIITTEEEESFDF